MFCSNGMRFNVLKASIWFALGMISVASQSLGAGEKDPVDIEARKKIFDALIIPEVERIIQQPVSKEAGEMAWGVAYQMAALVEMLDATRENKYAELFVKMGDSALAARNDKQGLADEIRGGVLPAWSSTGYTKGKRYNWAVHTGMIAAPMAQFCKVVRSDPSLMQEWESEAARFLEAAEAAVAIHDAEYREGPNTGEGYVYCPYLKKHLPLNMQNALARAWLAIDDATKKPKRREHVTRLANFFKNRTLAMDDGSVVWAYWPPLEGSMDGFEDTSHAAINADFMALCHEHEIIFTAQDLKALEATLLKRIIISNDRISDTIGGGDAVNSHRVDVLRWSRLARHSAPVRERLTEFAKLSEFEKNTTSLPLGLALMSLSVAAGK